jgi:hypothetical protein
VELVEGPRKCILTKKAREAAEVPLKWVKLRPATMKASASASVSTVYNPPAASVKSSSATVAIPVSIADSIESISKRIRVCPSDYTDDDYNRDWGTDQYSSPLPAPSSPLPATSSPTLYETDDNNVIDIDSEAEDVKPIESADAELGM